MTIKTNPPKHLASRPGRRPVRPDPLDCLFSFARLCNGIAGETLRRPGRPQLPHLMLINQCHWRQGLSHCERHAGLDAIVKSATASKR